jgi:hypothetical protein
MSNQTLLEAELVRRKEPNSSTEEEATELWNHYVEMRRYLRKSIYPFTKDANSFFTDHGEKHVHAIMRVASSLLKPLLIAPEQGKPDRRGDLTNADLFVLLSSILWHDAGMVFGRIGHEKRVAEMTEELADLTFPTFGLYSQVISVALAHTGESGLESALPVDTCTTSHDTYTIYPRALAALLRFADEISEDESRIDRSIMRQGAIPERSRIYWEYASCIKAVVPDPGREEVALNIGIQADKAAQRYACTQFKDPTSDDESIPLIHYVIRRLEKMNNERAYCAPEFKRYVSIREMHVRLSLLKETRIFKDYDRPIHIGDGGLKSDAPYPNIHIFGEFFEKNPRWTPDEIERELS